MDKYSHATYACVSTTAIFSGLSLYEWSFILGVFASICLGVLTYRLNRQEQMKRTLILKNILENLELEPASKSSKIVSELINQAPKEL
ncbi:bacteriophage protein [Xenorhabdus mauleonii]|uniref:Bacteriophage protein n=1 Tax=Xenorhabdus mauleonii TaxID=351675 RepID=A0A1I3S3N2_9GAMM|nr:hypothetical protein [Xenorhabdus mauleonii]PHM46344.1 bacteriophage protein [Xenorhabdus mauleonii]SFJ52171.1 hypothetical protein SAMN05421680_110138 [Xenorhabdus mauleonii]